MSLKKWAVLLTLLLIITADVLGFMANAGMSVSRVHATIGLLAAVAGLVSAVLVFKSK